MKSFILSLILLLQITLLFAQKKNEISIFTHDTYVPWYKQYPHLLEQYGFSYERVINKKFSISASYSEWYVGSLPNIFKNYSIYMPFHGMPCPTYFSCMKKIYQRYKYKFIDINVQYNKQLNKNYTIKMGIAPSISFGTNRILDTLIISPIPPFDNTSVETHFEKGLYFGLVPRVEIGRKVWRNFYAFYFINFRKYFGLETSQIDNGIKIGYKF